VDATLVQFTAQGRAPEYADRVLGPPRSTQTKAEIASTFSRGRSGCPGIGVEKYALRRVGQCPIMPHCDYCLRSASPTDTGSRWPRLLWRNANPLEAGPFDRPLHDAASLRLVDDLGELVLGGLRLPLWQGRRVPTGRPRPWDDLEPGRASSISWRVTGFAAHTSTAPVRSASTALATPPGTRTTCADLSAWLRN